MLLFGVCFEWVQKEGESPSYNMFHVRYLCQEQPRIFPLAWGKRSTLTSTPSSARGSGIPQTTSQMTSLAAQTPFSLRHDAAKQEMPGSRLTDMSKVVELEAIPDPRSQWSSCRPLPPRFDGPCGASHYAGAVTAVCRGPSRAIMGELLSTNGRGFDGQLLTNLRQLKRKRC